MHTSQEYFLRVLFELAGIDAKKIDREHINMAIKMVYDDVDILEKVYSFIVRMPNPEIKHSIIKMLIVNYARFMGNTTSKNIPFLADSEKEVAMQRFDTDSSFALDLLHGFITLLDDGSFPSPIDENLEDILKINVRYEVYTLKTLEDVLNEALVRIMKVLYDTIKDSDLAVALITSLFFGGKLISLRVDIDADVELIHNYRDYIIRMGYARLYAIEVGTDEFVFDEDFLAKFDEHIFDGNFDFSDLNYARDFITAYVKSLGYKGDVNLSEDQYSYVRSINPMYMNRSSYDR